MALTTRFGIEIPDVGADADMWGNILNNYFNALEPLIFDKRGDIVNGNLTVTGSTSVTTLAASGALTSVGLNSPFINGATTLELRTAGTTKAVVDNAGNLGLGVTPSAWASSKVFDIESLGTGGFVGEVSTEFMFGRNGYNDGSWRYTENSFSQLYQLASTGAHIWYTAPSGTAGAPISFRQDMTLTQGGNLLVGTTNASGQRVIVNGVIRSMQQGTRNALSIAVDNTDGAPSWLQQNIIGHYFTGTQDAVSIRVPSSSAVNTGSYDILLDGTHIWYAQGGSNNNGSTATERARITSAGNFRPGADNAYSLGEPSFRWSVVYAATGTINTSDVRAKLDFAPSFGLEFINALEPVSYRYKNGKTVIDQVEDGVEDVPAVLDEEGNEVTPATTKPKFKSVERVVEGQRRHHGLKAQQVKSVLEAQGLGDFAGWVMDDPSDAESGQGLRYDQFIAPLIRAVQEQQAMIVELQSRLAALEAK